MQDKILRFSPDASIISAASVVGKCEFEGPIGDYFDTYDSTDRFGQKSWEKAESEMQKTAMRTLMTKAKVETGDIGAVFAGDLLNQCVASAYGLIDFDIPFFGIYGACSTSAETLMLSAMLVNAGYYDKCAAVTSSHNSAAERQYHNPIEYGGQRTPTAQWTVTGAGAFLVGKGGNVHICEALPGIVVEKGITDANNMGAAMAPAVAQTIMRYFQMSTNTPDTFDLILTGDLGHEGSSILCKILLAEGLDIRHKHNDCGIIIYNKETQDKHAGGSGCGCAAVVLASYIYPKIAGGELKNVLFIASGAMMSPSSLQQGEAIPAIGHLLHLCTLNN